jgi:hypothetical protein
MQMDPKKGERWCKDMLYTIDSEGAVIERSSEGASKRIWLFHVKRQVHKGAWERGVSTSSASMQEVPSRLRSSAERAIGEGKSG